MLPELAFQQLKALYIGMKAGPLLRKRQGMCSSSSFISTIELLVGQARRIVMGRVGGGSEGGLCVKWRRVWLQLLCPEPCPETLPWDASLLYVDVQKPKVCCQAQIRAFLVFGETRGGGWRPSQPCRRATQPPKEGGKPLSACSTAITVVLSGHSPQPQSLPQQQLTTVPKSE